MACITANWTVSTDLTFEGERSNADLAFRESVEDYIDYKSACITGLDGCGQSMITIYAPKATDFSTLGLGALAPYEVEIEEQAGGMYELTMTHPMDEDGKWLNIGIGCIIKAPAPVRETPLAGEDDEGEIPAEPVTVTRKIYKVQTNTGANLHLRQGPSTSTPILSKYRPGTEVAVLSQENGWGQVIVCSSGATGYMSMQYLVYVRDETETIEGDVPSPERLFIWCNRACSFSAYTKWSETRRNTRCASRRGISPTTCWETW